MKLSRKQEWDEAQQRCRLSHEAMAMAKELGMSPRSLTENIPNRNQPWKAPVEDWIRRLHQRRFGRPPRAQAPTSPPPEQPPVAPAHEEELPPAGVEDTAVNELERARDELLEHMKRGEIDPDWAAAEMDRLERETPISTGEVADQDRHLLRRRDGFRRFAELFAAAAARLEFVQKVVLFGSVAAPLRKEVPRFRRLRQRGIAVWHECKDVDLAVWVTDLGRLRELKRVVSDSTNAWQLVAHREHFPGIPHHQVDVFILEAISHRYRGNLCHYGQCPKDKPECAVAGCGAQPFLQLYEDFPFDRGAPLRPPAVVLFERPPSPSSPEPDATPPP